LSFLIFEGVAFLLLGPQPPRCAVRYWLGCMLLSLSLWPQAGFPARADPMPARAAPNIPNQPGRVDVHGDPLPAGAVARLGTTRYRHHDWYFAGFGPDGRSLLFLSPSSYHRVDPATGKVTRTIEASEPFDFPFVGHNPGWHLAAKVPVLTRDAHLHDVHTGKKLAAPPADLFKGKGRNGSGYFTCLLSPDAKYLIVSAEVFEKTETIVVYATATQKRLHEFRGKVGHRFHPVKLAGDGKTLAAIEHAPDDAKQWLLTWDVVAGKLLGRVELDLVSFPHLEPLPDGRAVLVADWKDYRIRLIDAGTGTEIRSFEAPNNFAVSPDGKFLLAASSGTIQEWAIATGKPGRTFRSDLLRSDEGAELAFDPHGNYLAAIGYKTWTVWDYATGKELATPAGHVDFAVTVAFAPDGKSLLTSGADSTARLWNVATGKQTHRLDARADILDGWKYEWPARQAAFSGDGKLVVTPGMVDEAYCLQVWDAASGKRLHCLKEGEILPAFALSPHGQMLAVAGGDGQLRLFHAGAAKELRSWLWNTPWNGYDRYQAAPTFSPDGRLLALPASAPGTTALLVELWETATGKKRKTLAFDLLARKDAAELRLDGSQPGRFFFFFQRDPASRSRVVALLFSPDGKHLAIATLHAIHLFDVGSGKLLRSFGGPHVFGGGIAFSPNGKLLAAGRFHGDIRVWDTAKGTVLRDVPGHQGAVSSVAFSPDGKWLASASVDMTVLLWNVEEILRP
jgi:WD40 repeat protein